VLWGSAVDSERCVFEDEAYLKPSFSTGVRGARRTQSRTLRAPGRGDGRCAGLTDRLRECLMLPILCPSPSISTSIRPSLECAVTVSLILPFISSARTIRSYFHPSRSECRAAAAVRYGLLPAYLSVTFRNNSERWPYHNRRGPSVCPTFPRHPLSIWLVEPKRNGTSR
jgi:hypothetical protein